MFNLGLENVKRDSYENQGVEVIDKETLLAYADDIIILGNSRSEVTRFIY